MRIALLASMLLVLAFSIDDVGLSVFVDGAVFFVKYTYLNYKLLLLGLIVGASLFMFPEKILLRNRRAILLLCVLWWLIIVIEYRPSGSNLSIYSYNAEMQLSGFNAFAANDPLHPAKYWKHPEYLDYSGAQHLLFVGLTKLTFAFESILVEFGFRFWTVLTISVVLMLICIRNRLNGHLLMILLSFHAVFALFWFIDWQDKISILVIPLAVLILIERRFFKAASAVIGAAIAFNGFLVFFVPAFLVYCWREKQKIMYILPIMTSSFTFVMIPYFPDSLVGWKLRARIDALNHPFWFSPWLLIEDLYFSRLNNLAMIVVSVASALLLYQKKISIQIALVACVFAVLCLEVATAPNKGLTVIMLILVVRNKIGKLELAVVAASLFVFCCMYYAYLMPITPLHGALFLVPFVVAIIIGRKRILSEDLAELEDEIIE